MLKLFNVVVMIEIWLKLVTMYGISFMYDGEKLHHIAYYIKQVYLFVKMVCGNVICNSKV